MNKNILIITGSPRSKKGNSESIADSLIEKLSQKKLTTSKICLKKEIGKEENNLIEVIDKADIIILSLPIYENSVSGMILQFFENIYKNKSKLLKKSRRFFAITNSGFPEVEANETAIKTCRLFAKDMGFSWMGGISVAPGTLIDGKKLEETGGTYKRLIMSLNLIAEAILNDDDIPQQAFKLMEKSFIMSFIYRLGGRMVQKPVIKKIGKDKFLSTPLQN